MTQLGEAFVPIRATLDKLDGDLADAKSKIGGALEGLGKIGGAALGAGLAVATAAVAGLSAALAFSVTQALDAEQGQARLAQVLQSTEGAAGMTLERANELAQEFMHLAGGSDDAVLAIEEIGLRAGSVAAEDFPAFIQASLDLGAVMGDNATAATLLARAQEDPIAALGRLQRTGIIFSDSLKDQIAAMVKQGDTAGATALLMDRVAEATGGAAASNAATLAGQWAILQGTLAEAAEEVGMALLPALHDFFDNVIKPAIPVVQEIATSFASFLATFASGDFEDPLGNLANLVYEVANALGLDGKGLFFAVTSLREPLDTMMATITDQIIPAIQGFIEQIAPIVEAIGTWLVQNVALQDVLIALGIAIGIFIVTAVAPLIASIAPIVLTFAAVVAAAALLRQAWESNFGGIQEKTAAVWAQIQPLLEQARQWLEVQIPIALEALRAWWVDQVWPAIQGAIEAVWPVIQTIFMAIVDFILNVYIPAFLALHDFWVNVVWPAIASALASAWAFIQPIFAAIVAFVVDTLIPTILTLYTQWTTVWWPQIETALTNAWTVISAIFAELGRWINDNIVPWVEFLGEKWAEIFDAIQAHLAKSWAIIEPIWVALKAWLDTTIPIALNALQPIFESVLGGIAAALSPVKDLWDRFATAVSDFWSWISSHVFSFSISLPDLPDWAVPGSPLPIHTAWKNFAGELNNMTIAPKVDLDAMLPVMAAVGEDDGPARNITYSSQTTVNTSRDPLRVLRASRHLDKLGALA